MSGSKYLDKPGLQKLINMIKALNQGPTSIPEATTTTAGLMSAADKAKLDSGYVVKHDSGGYYVEV